MNNSETTTVFELGRRAGCSIATVSRVLNNSGAVSLQKREAILKAIRETEYFTSRPRRGNRRSTAKKKSCSVVEIVYHRHSPVESLSIEQGQLRVGALPPVHCTGTSAARPFELGNAFHRNMVDGAIEELARWDYRTQIRLNSDLLDPALLADINGPERSGVLLIGEYSRDLPQFLGHCQQPLVLVDLISKGREDVVTTDNFEGICVAFDHLQALGHRRIGFIGQCDEVAAFSERFTAYKLRMAEAGLGIRRDWIYEGPDHIETTAEATVRILQRPDRPTALMCSNDCYALGVLRAASTLGISVPKGLSVMGFDDDVFASVITPALSTVRVPVNAIGWQAARQLMIQIQHAAPARSRGCHVRLIPELIVRGSTAVPGV